MLPLSLYIHIPFCVKKCHYCDFLSFSGLEDIYDEYTNTLIKEIKMRGSEFSGYSIKTVFLGGGTPSILKEKNIGHIMDAINMSFNISEDAEITIEANPGTVTSGKLKEYQLSGINRISFGLQSFDDRLLSSLGRIHTRKDFFESFAMARKDFQNINLDIMFSLPGQTLANWKETLSETVSSGVEHISAYSLILEEGTKFYELNKSGLLKLPSEEADREMYHFAVGFLGDAGYKQYEISNFAKEGFQSRHNTVYWERGEYLGLGLGAHSLLNDERFNNTKDMKKYLSARGDFTKTAGDKRTLTYEDKISEFLFLGLRMTKGVSLIKFKETFRQDLKSVFPEEYEKLASAGLIEEAEDNLRLTQKGIDISNYVFSSFML